MKTEGGGQGEIRADVNREVKFCELKIIIIGGGRGSGPGGGGGGGGGGGRCERRSEDFVKIQK